MDFQSNAIAGSAGDRHVRLEDEAAGRTTGGASCGCHLARDRDEPAGRYPLRWNVRITHFGQLSPQYAG
jgi:hypothetical protein